MYLNKFSTCLCSGLKEANACIIAEKTKIGTTMISFVKLNVKKFTINYNAIVHLIVSSKTVLKYLLSFTLFTFISEINPKLNAQINVSLSSEMSQSPNLKSRNTYKAVCTKKAKSDTGIFQTKRALITLTIELLMLLLNIQAVKAIKIQVAQANSLVEKLSMILSIYFVCWKFSISGVVHRLQPTFV